MLVTKSRDFVLGTKFGVKEEYLLKLNPEERVYVPFRGPFDPCPPLPYRTYVVPVNQFIVFQPTDLPQFSPADALKHGTLWPALYSPYNSRNRKGE